MLIRLLSIATLRSWANVGLATFLPLLLVERGQSVEDGAMALAVLLFFGGVGGLIAGFLADRFGRDTVIVGLAAAESAVRLADAARARAVPAGSARRWWA